jgi:hypothetical protein
MANEPQNLVLVYLRRIDQKVDGAARGFPPVQRADCGRESQVAALHVSEVRQNAEIERIERRLELTDR